MASQVMQDSDTTHCIKNCLTCHQTCLETLHYVLGQKSTHFQGEHVALLQACVDTCSLSAKMMIADLAFHHQSCELCFEVCDACAIECERYSEDPQMIECAEVCRMCAESCRAMAGMTVSTKSAHYREGAHRTQ